MSNLSKNQPVFYFNWNSWSILESENYIKELKLAAESTADRFGVWGMNFSTEDFRSMVVSAKQVGYLHIFNSLIPLDSEFDFGEQLDYTNIHYFDVCLCGCENKGNWAENPNRFENLVEAISKSLPFRNNLKTLNITGCELSKEKAEQIWNKYGLHELNITGTLF